MVARASALALCSSERGLALRLGVRQDSPRDRSRRDDYLARPRTAAKPAVARSAASMTIAHSESAGMPVLPPPASAAQAAGTVIVFAPFVVTVPPKARALPVMFAFSPNVTPAASRILPTNEEAPPLSLIHISEPTRRTPI